MNYDNSNLWTDHDNNEALSSPLLSDENDITTIQSSCSILVRVWHIVDGLVLGVVLCFYGWSVPIVLGRVLLLLLGTIRIVRFGLICITPTTKLTIGWCLACTVIYVLLALVSLGMKSKMIHYIVTHESELHIGPNIGHFLEHHTHTIWIMLLAAAVLELALAYTRINKQNDLALSTLQEQLRTTPGGPPWANHTRSNPRVDVAVDQEGIQRTAARNRRLFSNWFNTPSQPTDLRDDGSVDFSSVQDEWASRSEEDPFWWTKTSEGAISIDENKSLGW